MPQFDYTSVPRLKKNAASLVGAASVWRGSTATFTITNYDSFHSWSVTSTKGTVTRTNEVISVAIDAAEPAGFATLTVTRNGIADSVQFEVLANAVAAPTITSPADGATDLMDGITLTTSAFATLPADQDTHAGTDWQIATDPAFTNIVWQSTANAADLVSISVPSGILAVSTTYYARARHSGTTLGAGAWSATVSFTMAAAYYGAGVVWPDGSVIAGQLGGNWIVFAPDDEPAQLKWGRYGIDQVTAKSAADGLSNTQALYNENADAQAAIATWEKSLGGYQWYLPAKDELYLLWQNRAQISGGLAALGVAVDGTRYLSSTQFSTTDAWAQVFSDGSQLSRGKTQLTNVRACRRVPV